MFNGVGLRRSQGWRRRLVLMAGIVLSTVCLVTVGSQPAQAADRTLDCRRLAGAGTYSNPLRVGTITRRTHVVNRRPLTLGSGFNLRYFLFDMPRVNSGTYVMTCFRAGSGLARVSPALTWGARTVKPAYPSVCHQKGTTGGQAQFMNDLWGGYNWRLRAQKLNPSLYSTNSFNIVFQP